MWINHKWVFIVTELFGIAVNDKCARSQVLVVTWLVVSGAQCVSYNSDKNPAEYNIPYTFCNDQWRKCRHGYDLLLSTKIILHAKPNVIMGWEHSVFLILLRFWMSRNLPILLQKAAECVVIFPNIVVKALLHWFPTPNWSGASALS